MVQVKICGIKSLEDALISCRYGADYLGFIFINGTPRYCARDEAASMIKKIPLRVRNKVILTGLFNNEDPKEVCSIVSFCGLDMVQLQGQESPEECAFIKRESGAYVAKALKVKHSGVVMAKFLPEDYNGCDYFVFDTFDQEKAGGTGITFEWKNFSETCLSFNKPFFVAGGLNPGNVACAVKTLDPFGVDVSSGVEISPGHKDIKKVKEFIKNAKTA